MTRRSIAVLLCLALGACSRASGIQISATPAGAFEAALTPFENGFIGAWYDTRDGHAEVYARRLDAEGHPIGPERRLTNGNDEAYEPDIAPLRDGFVVGWYEKAKNGHVTPKLGAWSPDGTARWVATLAGHGRNTVVRASGGLVFAAWLEDETPERSGVWVTWRRADNVDLIPPRRIADASHTTWNLNAAIDPEASPGNPRAWLVFDARVGTKADEIFLAETTESADHVVRLTPDDGAASKYPDVALSSGRAAVTWFDAKDGNEEVYLTIGDRNAYLQGNSPAWVRITSTSGHSIGAYVAWNGRRFGLAWCDNTSGNQELYYQSFDREGGTRSDVVRVTNTATDSSIPAIKPTHDGFALLWNEYEATAGDVHGNDRRSQVFFTLVR